MAADSDNTQPLRKGEHLAPYRFQAGNPGRPKGSRNKLSENFLADVLEEWEANGRVAISDMREKNPADFCKMVASLLPKDVNLNFTDNMSDLSDDELLGQLRDLSRQLTPLLAITEQGTEAPGSEQVTPQLH